MQDHAWLVNFNSLYNDTVTGILLEQQKMEQNIMFSLNGTPLPPGAGLKKAAFSS